MAKLTEEEKLRRSKEKELIKQEKNKLKQEKEKKEAFEKMAKKFYMNHDFHIILEKLEGLCVVTDQSKNHSGILVIDLETDKIIDSELFLLDEKDFIIAAHRIQNRVEDFIRKYNPVFLGIESTFFNRLNGADTFEVLSYIKNKLVELAYSMKIQVTTVPPGAWKAPLNFDGNYKEQKKQSIELANEIVGEGLFTSDDLSDPYHMYRYIKKEKIEVIPLEAFQQQ